MRLIASVSSLVLASCLAAYGIACGSSQTSPPSTPEADAATTLTYSPAGCGYTVTPPESRAFIGLALDDTKPFADPAEATPTRVRLGLGGGTTSGAPGYADPTTSAAFTWETPGATNAAKVRLGDSPPSAGGALGDVHAGYSWTTPPPERGLGNNDGPAYMHEVHVCGLAPGKTYYYQVGGGPAGAEAWSATQTFTTLPASGKITFGLSGDSRDDVSVFQLVQQRMRESAVSLQLWSGDLVQFGTEQSLFRTWLDAVWKDPADGSKFLTLGQQMILPVPGNHENDSAQFYGDFALPGDGPFAESFASFNLGSAHIVLLDDQPVAAAPTSDAAKAALDWLDQDLSRAEADRTAHPFIVVVHHRGELSTSTHADDSDVKKMREALMPIWDKHTVDLVLNGHDHNYERSKPVRGPAASPVVQTSATAGTTYVVCAGSGATAYAPGGGTVAYREKNAGFGTGTPYVGLYALVTLDGSKLSVRAYGLKSGGGGVAGDDLLDSLDLSR